MSQTTSAAAAAPAAVPAVEPTTEVAGDATAPAPAPGAVPESAPPAALTTAPEVIAPTPTTTSEPTPAPTASEKVVAPSTTAATGVPEPTPAPVPAASTAESKDAKTADFEEPQNPLTKKFTDAEWAALKDFRAQLPDIYAEAFPDKKDARSSSISIWGIELDPVNAHTDARASVVLMKFLRARNLNPTAAREMLVGTLKWRESFNIPAALEEKFPEDVFGNLGHIHGKDLGGRPVVYNLYGGNEDLKSVFGDVQRFIRWRVAFMERSVYKLDFVEIDQCIQVHDYEGVSLTSRDANSKAAASEASNIFASHYPELLYKKFFVNVPTLLNWIFWVFKPIISANTLAKMSVVGTGQHALKKALSEYITLDELPSKYGGNAQAF